MRWNERLRKSGMEATTRCAFRSRWGEGCSGLVLQHHRYQRTRELDVLNWSSELIILLQEAAVRLRELFVIVALKS